MIIHHNKLFLQHLHNNTSSLSQVLISDTASDTSSHYHIAILGITNNYIFSYATALVER